MEWWYFINQWILKKIGLLHGLTWLYFPRSFFALRPLRHPGFPELLRQAPWCVSSKATAEISHLGTDHRSSRWLKHKAFFDIVYIDDDDYYYYYYYHYCIIILSLQLCMKCVKWYAIRTFYWKCLTPRFQVLSNVKRHTKEYRQAPRHHRNTCCFVVGSNTCARYSWRIDSNTKHMSTCHWVTVG